MILVDGADDARLETPKQLAARVNVTERQIRHLIQTRQLEHVLIGCRVHIPVGAFTRYIDANKVTPAWHGETKDRACAGSASEASITSSGLSAAAAASARLARQTANRLKTSSRIGCMPEPVEPGRVIPVKFS